MGAVTKKQISEALADFIKNNPVKAMTFMLIEMGKQCHESGAGSIELKSNMTFDNKRYEVKAIVTTKRVK